MPAMSLLASAMLSAWLVVPLAGATMLAIAIHIVGLQSPSVPPRRRRIRTANGLIMLVLTALLAYALGVEPEPVTGVASQSGRSFLMLWLIILTLLAMVMLLAALDMAHTVLLGVADRRALRRTLRVAPPEPAPSPAEGPRSG